MAVRSVVQSAHQWADQWVGQTDCKLVELKAGLRARNLAVRKGDMWAEHLVEV
eukprot:CAMPEP_0114417842 /NCGR_PEP_ID=MMETSP0103-20121206/3179_1 /TAXON_ID=37642 ORGANISM="Paraphysomonas imperforata, Strain PA2" /NCGR_SAMPLE_ID=MMETSP0103 /ASSEMBLY_ACC=CAM_ASM_000201 /LENGTH=52 /DNA_ID=CAMNT_0001586161 /DNA_START=83 /DNA_END=241 /DNA_ORIENTATION=+